MSAACSPLCGWCGRCTAAWEENDRDDSDADAAEMDFDRREADETEPDDEDVNSGKSADEMFGTDAEIRAFGPPVKPLGRR